MSGREPSIIVQCARVYTMFRSGRRSRRCRGASLVARSPGARGPACSPWPHSTPFSGPKPQKWCSRSRTRRRFGARRDWRSRTQMRRRTCRAMCSCRARQRRSRYCSDPTDGMIEQLFISYIWAIGPTSPRTRCSLYSFVRYESREEIVKFATFTCRFCSRFD